MALYLTTCCKTVCVNISAQLCECLFHRRTQHTVSTEGDLAIEMMIIPDGPGYPGQKHDIGEKVLS